MTETMWPVKPKVFIICQVMGKTKSKNPRERHDGWAKIVAKFCRQIEIVAE